MSLKGILYALLLMPLLVWSGFLFPFITTKILYFRILVDIALIIYFVLALQYPEIRPRWNWLQRAVWIYLGVAFVASVFGVDFSHSIMGTVERGEGLISVLHFVIYFTILSSVLRTDREWYRYLFTTGVMILLMAVYGFIQLQCFGFDSSAGNSICGLLLPTQGQRISATIGNAAFFAGFILFGVFLSYYLSRQTQSRFQKYFLWAAAFFELYIVFESRTRGAVLAAAAGIIIFALFGLFKSRSIKFRAISLIAIGLLVAAGLTVYYNRDAGWIKKSNTLERLATISPTDITTQSRFDTWGASWKALQDRPILGYGYENYNIAFNKYFPPRIFKDQGSQIWFDRAHDIVFDIALTSGFAGLAVYLAIFIICAVYLFKLFRRPEVDWTGPAALMVLLAVYFLQNVFVFDTQATYLMFFLVLAFVASLHTKFLSTPISGIPKSYYPGYIAPIVLTIFISVTGYFINIEPASANRAAIEGMKTSRAGDFKGAEVFFKRSLSYGTYMDIEIRQRMVDTTLEAVLSKTLSPEDKDKLFQYTIDQLEISLKDAPADAKNHLYLMTMYNRLGTTQALDKVISLGDEVIKLSSSRPQIYFELGQAYFGKKDFDKGLAEFQKAVALNPATRESQFNYLIAAVIAGREDLIAEQNRTLVSELGYIFSQKDYENLARAYLQSGNKAKVVEYYRLAVDLNPQSADLRGKLAAAYGDPEICDIQNATLEANEASRLNSSYALEAQQFIQQVEAQCK
ncbi:MAG: Tetratricopeptide TPR_2 repeat protein [Parcubacteria group bacterium GW2011_GWA2_51_12]|nr:MAG: Tetratricopeptide TPR_2 repeat protein [Parcubacteria group bacterium GW2011_GWA2_51_12]